MATTEAISAFGTLLQIGDGESPEEFTTIAELRTLSGPTLSADTIDVTVHNTPTPFRRFIAGLLDGGEISFEINFVPTSASHGYSDGLLATWFAREEKNYQLVFPNTAATTWLIPAIITQFSISSEPADVLRASLNLKVTGPPTFA